jgi:hypothetical protein
MDSLYKLCDMTRPNTKPTSLVADTNERSRTWHEQLRHLMFLTLQSMETQKMVACLPITCIPKIFSINPVQT